MAPAAAATAPAACVMTHTACARPFTSGGARPAAAAAAVLRQGAGGSRRRAMRAAAAAQRVPDFIPAEFAAEIEEPAAQAMMAAMRRVPLDVPGFGQADTAFVGPEAPTPGRPAFVLLHGFDSSCLEFRRFHPLLSQLGDVYAVDLAGWGFTDCGFGNGRADQKLGPAQKRAHLRAFLQQVVQSGGGSGNGNGSGSGRPVVLVGTSLGGTVAIDYATNHPEDLERLVLIDAQGFIDGIGPLASLPRFLATLGVKVLRSVPLRQAANQMAYFNKQKFATDDAMRIGRLHTHLPGWTEANVAFMQSGGYAVSNRIGDVSLPTLVVWGRNDEILSPDYAQQFIDTLPQAELVWVDECGHCAHLEQPHALLQAVARFTGLEEAAAEAAAELCETAA